MFRGVVNWTSLEQSRQSEVIRLTILMIVVVSTREREAL